jgi:exopolyphosphatase/guanosine-5'-triphosphate,3'-diphosphate pyrophosphatase
MTKRQSGASRPVGVLDIGSNSVRLVVYERLCRALSPLYNEKAACALGRGVAKSGRLAPESVERALTAIRRFALVAELNRTHKVHILATSAVREAREGFDFIDRVETIMGAPVRVLSGREEAHFSALGVVSGMPGQTGLVGDFGGGSLELAEIRERFDTAGETLPLGAIRLQDDSGGSVKKARRIARDQLRACAILGTSDHRVFSAIGGTWRALAKLHQMQSRYPLHLVQHYRTAAAGIRDLCEQVMAGEIDADSVPGYALLSSNRRELLPYGAAVMAELLSAGEFESVQFSALGVREGYLFDQLAAADKHHDPLLEHAADLDEFCGALLAALGIRESVEERRLRHAACELSDVGWRGHPDYRGEQAVDMVAYGSFIGIDHPGRAFLAQALAIRYMGLKQSSISEDVIAISPPAARQRARIVGACLAVGYLLSAARPGLLPQLGWQVEGDRLILQLPPHLEFLAAEKMVRRLEQLADEVKMAAEVVTAP